MKVSVTNIQYDTDGEEVDLPTELTIEVEDDLYAEEIEEQISEEISNITGYCHEGFSMDIPKMSNEEYISNVGNKCPYCRSANIRGTDFETDDGISAWRVIECEECEKSWRDVFNLTSIEMTDE